MMMIHAEVQVVIHKNGGFYRSRNAKKKSRVVVEVRFHKLALARCFEYFVSANFSNFLIYWFVLCRARI